MIAGGVRIDTDCEWVWDILLQLYMRGKITGQELFDLSLSIGTSVETPFD